MKSQKNTGKTLAFVLGGLVYAGVVIVSTTLTVMFVTGILPPEAYLVRAIVSVGVVSIGLNAFALPVALHFWAVEGVHRWLAVFFYAADILIMGVNVITSFSTLSGNAPEWVNQYAPYSVSMLVFALVAWGVLKIADPAERANLELTKAQESFRLQAIRQAAEYLESIEGRESIAAAAQNIIPSLFDPAAFDNSPRHWTGRIPAQMTRQYAAETKTPVLKGEGETEKDFFTPNAPR